MSMDKCNSPRPDTSIPDLGLRIPSVRYGAWRRSLVYCAGYRVPRGLCRLSQHSLRAALPNGMAGDSHRYFHCSDSGGSRRMLVAHRDCAGCVQNRGHVHSQLLGHARFTAGDVFQQVL